MILPLTDIRRLLAGFYHRACLDASVDMLEFTALLEYLATVFGKENAFHCWTSIRLDSRKYNRAPYDQYLSDLRSSFYTLLTEKIHAEIKSENLSREEAGNVWQDYFFEALTAWCTPVYSEMIKWEQEIKLADPSVFTDAEYLVRLIYEDRWADTYNSFSRFAELTRDKQVSCTFFLALAQVKLYYLQDYSLAAEHITQAKKVCPQHPAIPRVEGEYFIKMRELEKARNLISEALSLEPTHPLNYITMGMSYKAEEKLDAAEQWIQDGEAINFMYGELYLKYTELLIDNCKALQREDAIETWIRKINVLEPPAPWNNFLYTITRYAGSAYLAANDQARGVAFFNKAIALDPELPGAYIDLANHYVEQQEYPKAEEYFHRAMQTDEQNYDPVWGLAGLYEKQERWNEAIENFSKGFRLRPLWNGWIHNSVGVIYFRMNDFEKAREHFTLAIESYSGDPIYYDNLNDTLEKLGRAEESAQVLLSKYHHNRQDAHTAFELAEHYYKQSDYTAAKRFARLAVEADPQNVQYAETLGLIEEALQEYSSAEQLFLKIYHQTPTYLTANRLGIFYYNRGRFDEAITYYQKAISLKTDDGVLFENIALAYSKKGEVPQAIEQYKRAIQLRPEAASLYYALGQLYESIDPVAASEYHRKATEYDKGGSYHNYLGSFYYNQGNFEEALKWFRQAVELDPDAINYRLWLSACLNKLNLLEESRSIIQTLAYQYPDNPDFTLRLAYVEFRMKNYKEAWQYFNRIEPHYINDPSFLEWYSAASLFLGNKVRADELEAAMLKIAPNTAGFYYDAALMYYESRLPDGLQRGVQRLEKALSLDPGNSTYFRILGNCHRLLGNNDEAEKALLQAIEMNPEDDIAHNDYGVFLYQIGNHAKAIEEYNIAISRQDTPLYRSNLELAMQEVDKLRGHDLQHSNG